MAETDNTNPYRSMVFSPNDSPLAGMEGSELTANKIGVFPTCPYGILCSLFALRLRCVVLQRIASEQKPRPVCHCESELWKEAAASASRFRRGGSCSLAFS